MPVPKTGALPLGDAPAWAAIAGEAWHIACRARFERVKPLAARLYWRDERAPDPGLPLPYLFRHGGDRSGERGCSRRCARVRPACRPLPPGPRRPAPARIGPGHRPDTAVRRSRPVVRAPPRRADDLRPCLDRRRPRRSFGSCHLVRTERDARPIDLRLGVGDAPVDEVVIVLVELP